MFLGYLNKKEELTNMLIRMDILIQNLGFLNKITFIMLEEKKYD